MPSSRSGLLRRTRFYTAALVTGVMNLNLFGLSLRRFCTPGFNCHGCPWATFVCPVGVLAYGSGIRVLPMAALGLVLATGVAVGRMVCGFACPFGWFQEILHRIPGKKLRLPRIFRYGKYAALAILVFALPFLLGFETAVENDLYYCRLCPNGTLTAGLPRYIEAGSETGFWARLSTSGLQLGILAFFLLFMVLVSRAFCRTFCPLGAAYGLLSPFALSRVRVDMETCIHCGKCDTICPVDLDVRKEAGGPECIACGDCIGVCPVHAIRRRYGP